MTETGKNRITSCFSTIWKMAFGKHYGVTGGGSRVPALRGMRKAYSSTLCTERAGYDCILEEKLVLKMRSVQLTLKSNQVAILDFE